MRFSRKTIAIAKVVLCFFVLDFLLRSESALANNQNNVSLTIAKHLFSKESHQDKNMVLSPLSLQVVLSIIATGSEGPTQQQLLNFLQSKSTYQLNSFASTLVSVILKDAAPASNELCLMISRTRYVSISPLFSLQNTYAVEVNNEVNLWAERETNGLIKELLPLGSVDYFTQLIFANALYFKGEWNDNFDASETNVYDFHLLNGNSVKVDFMTSDEKKQFIRDFDDFKVLGLPYKQGEDKRQFTMYFFLPNAKDGLPTLLEKLASESELLQHKLPLDKVEVGDFRIPRFNISFELETSDMLKELGVVLPFTNGGLTKMVNSAVSQNLYVSKIFHKSFIEVNEEGTKAAAATAGLLCGSSLSLPTDINFVADHPFLFIIREDLTGTIVFVGQVLNPLAR
ncbi:serpin-like protein [Medicago truncatula]|uniref:Serpin-like protein n=1 Tax=Medicago truncatula TaxID=3880 RepID=G7J5R2_MEDTR|nr:serpin-like protein [Medicago truncatula]